MCGMTSEVFGDTCGERSVELWLLSDLLARLPAKVKISTLISSASMQGLNSKNLPRLRTLYFSFQPVEHLPELITASCIFI
jgi:hypothetical protein